MNLGGPKNLTDVYGFLFRLFSDPDLIPIPFQKHLAPWIAKRRTPSIQEQYAAIGGGSPILKWTELQGSGMCKILDKISPESAPHEFFVGFRYADPLTEDALKKIKSLGIKRMIAFTQYPQYSCSTTGSSLNELHRKLKLLDPENTIKWSVIDRWYSNPKFILSIVDKIKQKIQKDTIVLFSAHSLPMSVVNQGDHYVHEVSATAHLVMQHFPNPYRVCWQSKVGPTNWMGPQTIDVLKKMKQKSVLVVPIAFTSDHIETLFELDLEYIQHLNKKGWNIERSESLNDSSKFIEAMADVVKNHISHSSQLADCCPMCEKQDCLEMRKRFIVNKP